MTIVIVLVTVITLDKRTRLRDVARERITRHVFVYYLQEEESRLKAKIHREVEAGTTSFVRRVRDFRRPCVARPLPFAARLFSLRRASARRSPSLSPSRARGPTSASPLLLCSGLCPRPRATYLLACPLALVHPATPDQCRRPTPARGQRRIDIYEVRWLVASPLRDFQSRTCRAEPLCV